MTADPQLAWDEGSRGLEDDVILSTFHAAALTYDTLNMLKTSALVVGSL